MLDGHKSPERLSACLYEDVVPLRILQANHEKGRSEGSGQV